MLKSVRPSLAILHRMPGLDEAVSNRFARSA